MLFCVHNTRPVCPGCVCVLLLTCNLKTKCHGTVTGLIMWAVVEKKQWPKDDLFISKKACAGSKGWGLEFDVVSVRSEIVIKKKNMFDLGSATVKGNNEVLCNLSWCPCKVCSKHWKSFHALLLLHTRSCFQQFRVTSTWSGLWCLLSPILDQVLGAFFSVVSRKITDPHLTFRSWGHWPRSKQRTVWGQGCTL